MKFINILLLTILIVIALPIALTALLVYFMTTGFDFLDFSLGFALFVLLLMFVGSYINIPLGKQNVVLVKEPRFFGLFSRPVWKNQGVSVNVGGAVIPLLIAGYFLAQIYREGFIEEFIITTVVVTVLSFLSARFVHQKGVVLSIILPVLFAALFALMLAPEIAVKVAFSAGVLGVLIGADVLRLPWMYKQGAGIMSIGGAGIFDSIFLVGIAAALLAGL